MKIPVDTVIAIAIAVERQGGTVEDAQDLCLVWERVAARNELRADSIRRGEHSRECCCADEPALGADGRCSRCYGRPKQTTPTIRRENA